MNKETMTVHMALAEMKTIEKRIDKAIRAIVPIGTKENASKNVNGIDVKKFEDDALSLEQRAVDLIARQNAMKAALYKYNTIKEIEVAGRVMTVAHALWLKSHGMDQKKALLEHYEKAYNKAARDAEIGNGSMLNNAAEKVAESACCAKDQTKSDEYLKIVDQYKESHRVVYVDPLDLKERINELSEEIEKFAAEVDAKIQTANAITEITIEY